MYKVPNNFAFIDGSNLHLTYAIGRIGWEMDYKKLRQFLRKRHNITVAYYFVGYLLKNSDVYNKLTEYGYELKHETATHNANGSTTGNLDEFLIKQVKWDINKYDQAVIISSDHHFADIVEFLDGQNKLKLVLAPCNKGCHRLLKKAANTKIEFLSDYKDRLEKLN